jgi:hypothetical protein
VLAHSTQRNIATNVIHDKAHDEVVTDVSIAVPGSDAAHARYELTVTQAESHGKAGKIIDVEAADGQVGKYAYTTISHVGHNPTPWLGSTNDHDTGVEASLPRGSHEHVSAAQFNAATLAIVNSLNGFLVEIQLYAPLPHRQSKIYLHLYKAYAIMVPCQAKQKHYSLQLLLRAY